MKNITFLMDRYLKELVADEDSYWQQDHGPLTEAVRELYFTVDACELIDRETRQSFLR